MNKVFKGLYNIIFYSFILIVIVFSIISFKADDYKSVNKIGEFAFCNILTESMTPKINPGDLIVIKEVDKVQVDDIVTFIGENTNSVVTHRVVEINNNGEYYTTKGDANDTVDSFKVKKEMIVGKVVLTIPYIGSVMKFIQENIFIILIGLVLVMILSEIFKGNAKRTEVKRNVKK